MPKREHDPADDGLLSAEEKWRPLPQSFFDAPPEQVARELLGKILVRRDRAERLAGRIVETEAYLGEQDAAAHAASGRTARNSVLFGAPGHAYVYGIYGLHYCFNVSCLREGVAGGVLVRALEPLYGIAEMRRNRGVGISADLHRLTSGPGNLCQAFSITRAAHNGLDLTGDNSSLGLVEDGFQCGEVRVTPRVGIRKAAELPLRFFLAGHACVSTRRR